MLERPGLLIGPWKQGRRGTVEGRPLPSRGKPLTREREICDAASGQFLGLVRVLAPGGLPGFRWLSRCRWEVLETEDESLLLTILCPWGLVRPWEVLDAEEHQICALHGNEIYDASSHLRVLVKGSASTGRQRFLGKDQTELAALHRGPEGLELRFALPVEGDPFAKMALLAAALVLNREN